MNKKAFNLFTALLSFLFIIIAFLIVQTMTTTERKTTDQITAIGASNNLQAVADMVKADAINSFNLETRKSIENYVTQESTPIYIRRIQNTPEDKEEYWNQVVEDYKKTRFGTGNASNFASSLASNITGYLASTGGFGNYSIRYIYDGTSIRQALQQSIEETEDFFTLVDCPSYSNCDKGTFYVTLDLTKLENSEYEKLPKLEVIDSATNEKIITPVLDKKKYRFYIPLRLFKIIAEGYKIAFSDRGILDMDFHNELEDYEIGACVKNSCDLIYLDTKEKRDSQGHFCYGDSEFDRDDSRKASYPDDLKNAIAEKVMERYVNAKPLFLENLEIEEAKVQNIIIARNDSAIVVNYANSNFQESSASEEKEIGHMKLTTNNGFEILENYGKHSTTEITEYLGNAQIEPKSFADCMQMTRMEFGIKIKEKDISYTVSGKEINYHIQITDDYNPYTLKYSEGNDTEIPLRDALWYCGTKIDFSPGGGGTTMEGCFLVEPK